MTARGRRRGAGAAAVPPEVVHLRDRRPEAWISPAEVDTVTRLRAQAVTGDQEARRELWRLGAASAMHCGHEDLAPAELLAAEVASTRRRNAVSAWRNGPGFKSSHVVELDPDVTLDEYADRLFTVLGGAPDLEGIDVS